eukprot:3219722-Prymnesium_polylepis.1
MRADPAGTMSRVLRSLTLGVQKKKSRLTHMHVHHAVASIVHASFYACTHLPARRTCVSRAPRRRVDCACI